MRVEKYMFLKRYLNLGEDDRPEELVHTESPKRNITKSCSNIFVSIFLDRVPRKSLVRHSCLVATLCDFFLSTLWNNDKSSNNI